MDSAGTTFQLIRHADYPLLGKVLAGRLPGHALSEEGRRQAAAVAAVLGQRKLAGVVSGPLQRTQETASPIARAAGLTVSVEPDLDEIDFGAWTGEPFEKLHADPAWQAFNVFRSTAPVPGGETMLAAQARAVAAIGRLRAAMPGAEIAVVTHSDTIKAILTHFLAMPLDLMGRLEIMPASRSELTVYAQDVRVRAINLPPGS